MGSKAGHHRSYDRTINLHPFVVWGYVRDMHGQLLPPEPEPVPPREDVVVVAKALVGAHVRQFASDRTSITFIGASGCGNSSLMYAVVGFPLITW